MQTTCQDKATQTEPDTMADILTAITTLCQKVDSIELEMNKIRSQQHDYKDAELCRSEDTKIPELEGDVGKHLKIHNVCLNTAAGTSRGVRKNTYQNSNMNKLFEKPFMQKNPEIPHKLPHTQKASAKIKKPTIILPAHTSKIYTKSKPF